ncbi:hypothetical protein V9T40_007665 [Parthenolecanium corni]|uniref:Uncharacterized protein n=1 Tax=Parthenolecanium corni TaxID=536013 RepID=A0AAN9Y624_9HEMI
MLHCNSFDHASIINRDEISVGAAFEDGGENEMNASVLGSGEQQQAVVNILERDGKSEMSHTGSLRAPCIHALCMRLYDKNPPRGRTRVGNLGSGDERQFRIRLYVRHCAKECVRDCFAG